MNLLILMLVLIMLLIPPGKGTFALLRSTGIFLATVFADDVPRSVIFPQNSVLQHEQVCARSILPNQLTFDLRGRPLRVRCCAVASYHPPWSCNVSRAVLHFRLSTFLIHCPLSFRAYTCTSFHSSGLKMSATRFRQTLKRCGSQTILKAGPLSRGSRLPTRLARSVTLSQCSTSAATARRARHRLRVTQRARTLIRTLHDRESTHTFQTAHTARPFPVHRLIHRLRLSTFTVPRVHKRTSGSMYAWCLPSSSCRWSLRGCGRMARVSADPTGRRGSSHRRWGCLSHAHSVFRWTRSRRRTGKNLPWTASRRQCETVKYSRYSDTTAPENQHSLKCTPTLRLPPFL
jgi:hypothetical protein